MDSVYIRADDLNSWVKNRLPNRDLFTIEDLIAAIEDMDSELESLQKKYDELEKQFDEYKQDNPPHN